MIRGQIETKSTCYFSSLRLVQNLCPTWKAKVFLPNGFTPNQIMSDRTPPTFKVEQGDMPASVAKPEPLVSPENDSLRTLVLPTNAADSRIGREMASDRAPADDTAGGGSRDVPEATVRMLTSVDASADGEEKGQKPGEG